MHREKIVSHELRPYWESESYWQQKYITFLERDAFSECDTTAESQ